MLLGIDDARLAAVANELDLPYRAVSLVDSGPLVEALRGSGLAAVLHCAGPFSDTAAMMMDACLATGTHYLGITGELDVIEATAARAGEAVSQG
jgi:saccharopine dehydrogenase (NAD+, L-lysine-forming)